MMKKLLFIFGGILFSLFIFGQDTTIVQTITYDSTGRDYYFQFPEDNGQTYEKIIMEYSMRCKNGLVSNQTFPNQGCGEWDYSCNAFIEEPSKTDSVKATHPSYLISDFSGDSFDYTSVPTYVYSLYHQYEVNYNAIISEVESTVGDGSLAITHPFSTNHKVSKTQYLITAAELSAAGVSNGQFTGLKLNVLSTDGAANFLRIRIKSTGLAELDQNHPELDGFTEVYFSNTSLVPGINFFKFYNPFTWNQLSNIIVEFSFTNTNPNLNVALEGHETVLNKSMTVGEEDNFLSFASIGRVDISNSDYSNVVNEVSVVFWAYGNPAVLPVNTSAFEARDEQDRRQVHAHLPWSNSGIYWDCGNDGSYDRIDKVANAEEIKGRWNHWAFTKNANTGDMKIYLNGEVWKSGTGKTKSIDIDQFKFGSNVSGSYPYFGFMDNFSVWDTELTQAEIQDWMYQDINSSHPEYSHLINYFDLNDGEGNVVSDLSPNNVAGIHSGIPAWRSYRGKDLFKSFIASNYRPNITFVQGVYNATVDEVEVLDSIMSDKHSIVSFQVVGTDLVAMDTTYAYQAGYTYVSDVDSQEIVDSVYNAVENTIDISTLTYYHKYPAIFEIMSFVTPYGLFLDLGMEGKTWQFDLTDFTPILKGEKRLYFTGGIYQEDLDVRFLFIEGTPTREVLDIQQIWRCGSQRNYQSIMNNTYFEPRNVTLNPSAAMYKIRSAITGHGQEGEFIPRTHYININGGVSDFQWQAWKECADNPIYPQGGTWIYDRAGWCPGAPTDLEEFEITDLVSPGETISIDYGIATASGDSRYIVSNQLVTYASPAFELDAELVEIQRPTDRVEFSRVNPVCYNPTVKIRNTGTTNLTSLTLSYGVIGNTPKEFSWTGDLAFNETEVIALPIEDASFWVGDGSQLFTAVISNPNGASDEYENNNTKSSHFELPDMYDEQIVIMLKTNNNANENEYFIKDHEGNVIFSRTDLEDNTSYFDTLDFVTGCYTLEMTDTGNDGLSFWANSGQGSGLLRIFSATEPQMLKSIETDFGKLTNYSYVLGDITYINESKQNALDIIIYPNPSSNMLYVDLGEAKIGDAKIQLLDMNGRIMQEKRIVNAQNNLVAFDLSKYEKGIYLCQIQTDKQRVIKKVILQ